MESDVTHSQSIYELWAWFEKNKKQVVAGVVALAIVALVVWFIIWRKAENRQQAGYALSAVATGEFIKSGKATDAPEPYIKVASEYANTEAGAQALLRAAGAYFVVGKYAEAEAQFQKFQREYRESPFLGQAILGIAASLEAQGRTDKAVEGYRTLVERHPTDPAVTQAKFALARIYAAQNKPEQARTLYEEIARNDPYGSIGSEAGMHLEELRAKYPAAFAPKAPVATNNTAPAITISTNAAPAGK